MNKKNDVSKKEVIEKTKDPKNDCDCMFCNTICPVCGNREELEVQLRVELDIDITRNGKYTISASSDVENLDCYCICPECGEVDMPSDQQWNLLLKVNPELSDITKFDADESKKEVKVKKMRPML